MAIRSNSIEYGWQTDSTIVNSGSTFVSSVERVHIPELASRTFTDVIMQFHGRNSGLEIVNTIGLYTMSIQIDSQPTESYYVQSMFNQTIEQISYTYFASASAYFNTYFTASAHNVKFYINSSNTRTIGHAFKLLCGYSFDDATVTNSIKTVRLPINSITASVLGTAKAYIGNYTASIPALDSYLPESSKTYRNIFIEYHSNDASTSTANFNLITQIDNNPSSGSRFTISQSLQSGPYYYEIQKLSGSIDTSQTHSIAMQSSVANRLCNIGGILHVTYEYDYTGSTSILNSNVYSMADANFYVSQRNQGETFFYKRIYIPETGSIELRRSGVMFLNGGSAPNTVYVSTNSSSNAVYTTQNASVQTGYCPLIFQIDGTGSHIPAITLASGYNDVRIYYSALVNTAGSPSFHGALLYLNYVSIRNGPPLTHAHTVPKLIVGGNNLINGSIGFMYSHHTASITMPDVNYYIVDSTDCHYFSFGAASNVPIFNMTETVLFLTGSEYYYDKANPLIRNSFGFVNDARHYFAMTVSDLTPFIQKYPNYTILQGRPKISLFTPRVFGYRTVHAHVNATSNHSNMNLLTYHSLTGSITGNIRNYSGLGVMPLKVYDYNSGELLFATSSKGGGVIDTFWYDRHSDIYVVAESGSLRYASNVLPAGSGSYIISIPTGSSSAPGGPVEHSFTFIG